MSKLPRLLRQEIERQGVIAFARFMEWALYQPEAGYYEREDNLIGTAGDFYTNVSTGSLFGELLAFQFAEWLPPPADGLVQLVEAGAHDGQLAADILAWLGKNRPALLEHLEYWIIEPSPRRRAAQQAKLFQMGRSRERPPVELANRVRWFKAADEIAPRRINGIIFSNELLDALPVHRLGWDAVAQRWFEWGVAIREEKFVWQRMPFEAADRFKDDLRFAGMEVPPELQTVLPDGFTIELSTVARTWWAWAAAALGKGKLVTFDYGLEAHELLAPQRCGGTLRAYRQHHLSPDLLANPGEQDLTAHVNFTQIQRAGEAAELHTEGLLSQSQFLVRVAEKFWKQAGPNGAPLPAQRRQFQTLVHPEHLGRAFRVLVQSREGSGLLIPHSVPLAELGIP